MKSDYILLILYLSFSPIMAQNSMEVFEKYHNRLCNILINTSNSIDDYFVEGNQTSKRSKTYAELSSSIAIENRQNFEKDIRLRLRLSLPKIQKNLRLIFEDDNNNDTLYDRTTLNDEKLIDKSYYLRLEYLRFIKRRLNLALGAGLRVRQGNLVPYLNLRSRINLYKKDFIKSMLYNRFRFYSDREIENIFEFNTLYIVNDSLYLLFRNQFSYSNKNKFEEIYHDLSLVKELSSKKQLNLGIGLRSHSKNFKTYSKEYYHIHTLYKHTFYKHWLYYQIAPSLLWREENHFKTSYRLMVNFGIYFKK